jgi:putrescine transport system substrate-binding protein
MTGKSGYDVVFPSNHFMARQIQGKALKNSTRASCRTGRTSTRCCSRPCRSTTRNEHGFPYLWGSTGIGYNIAKVKAVLGDNAPVDSWDLIFKPEYMEKLQKCGVAILDNGPELLPATTWACRRTAKTRGLQESRSAADESAAVCQLLPFLEIHQ